MPSVIWADRAPIHVVQEMSVIRSRVERTDDQFIVVDICDNYARSTSEQAIVRVGAISSVWKYEGHAKCPNDCTGNDRCDHCA